MKNASSTKRVLLASLAIHMGCSGFEEDESTAQDGSAIVATPGTGGPWGSNQTCSTTIQYWIPAGGPVAGQVVTYLNNAAINWGCNYSQSWHAAYPTSGLGAYKWYRTSSSSNVGYGTYNDCGVAFWNNDTQCAYFIPARDTTCIGTLCTPFSRAATSTRNILSRYQAPGFEGGLGIPISNPVPKGSSNTYYQLFTEGVITHHATYGTRALGGTDATDQALALAWRDRYGAHPNAPGSPVVQPLSQDAGCTAKVVGSTSCASIYRTGRYTRYFDVSKNLSGFVIARDGWSKAFIVDGTDAAAWVADAQAKTGYGSTPWSGGIGFPLQNSTQVGAVPGNPVFNQQFEWGNIVRQPTNCSDGVYVSTLHDVNAAPLTINGDTSGFCPNATIGPTCIQEEQPWVPFTPPGGGVGRYQLLCSLRALEWPVGIQIQVAVSGQPFGAAVKVYDPIFTDWKGGLTVPAAITTFGLPRSEESCSETTGWCNVVFDESAVYKELGTFDTFKVSGAFFTRYDQLGLDESCLGLPTSDSPSGAYPRVQTFAGGTITETSPGVVTSNCTTQLFDIYCWFPEVRGSETTDIHETLTNIAYFYWDISPEGDTKSGRPPGFLGLPTTPGGRAVYDTDVYGNNFQGPEVVNAGRRQWEFSNHPGGHFSTRIYPLIYGQKCIAVAQSSDGTSTPPDGGWKNSKIREDDEGWWRDDTVGYVRWDYYDHCNAAWAQGDTGWSAIQRSFPEDNKVSGDFTFFDYRHYCYRCRNQPTSHEECTTGVDTSWTLYGGDL